MCGDEKHDRAKGIDIDRADVIVKTTSSDGEDRYNYHNIYLIGRGR